MAVFLLDPNSGTAMSSDHQMLAEEIAYRYPEIRLAQIPNAERSAREEFPFALVHEPTDSIVKRLRESEMTIRFIFEWLYVNDTHRHGEKNLYDKFISENEKIKAEKQAKHREQLMENLDVVYSMANHQKHTYKHGNRKFS